MSFIRSISGLRATLSDGLLPETVSRYAAAFSQFCPDGKILIGRDGRPSGEWVEKIIQGTLSACGREVVILGVVPTPTVQLMVEEMQAAGGIVVTASHNPEQWNGMKFINQSGVFLDKEENEKLWKFADSGNLKFINTNDFPQPDYDYTAIDKHINKILSLDLLKKSSFPENVKSSGLKIVVDAVNSSGSVAVLSLLAKMGLEGIPLYCDGTGIFPHTPEPLAENLTELAKAVIVHKADLGIAVDPDADRLVLIDETGTPIGEEKTISLAVWSVLENMKHYGEVKVRNVVVNYSTTRLVNDIAEKYGYNIHRSAVGEINVVKKMKECGAIIGGEGSGGVILPACHYGRDSLVGIALVLNLLAQTGKKLSELTEEFPAYQMFKYKQEFSGSIEKILIKVAKHFKSAQITLEDGIRIDLPKSWVQLRSSNTEPIIRIIAEAETKTVAMELIEIVKMYLK